MAASLPRSPLAAAVALGGVGLGALLAFAAATDSLLIVVGSLALVVAFATVADWSIGIPLLLLVSSVDGFLKHLSASALTYVLKDAVLLLVLLGLTVRLALRPAERPSGARWRGLVMWSLYFGFFVAQLAHPAETIAGGIAAFRAKAAFSILLVAGAIYFTRAERLARAANGVVALCTFIALGAIVQQLMGPHWLALGPGFVKASLHYTSFPSLEAKAAGVAGASFRMYGTLVDPAALGFACAYGILTAIAALGRVRGFGRIALLVAIPLMALALELSQTRAAMGGLLVAAAVLIALLLLRPATRVFAVTGLVLIVAAVPLGIAATNGRIADRVLAQDSVAYAAQTRDVSRAQTLYELPRYPFGHGLGSTGSGGNLRDGSGFAVDNIYFSMLYETGVLGLATFLGMQVTLLWLGLRAALRVKAIAPATVFSGIVATQVALLVAGWFSQGTFDYAPVSQFFWLFSGAVVRSEAWT